MSINISMTSSREDVTDLASLPIPFENGTVIHIPKGSLPALVVVAQGILKSLGHGDFDREDPVKYDAGLASYLTEGKVPEFTLLCRSVTLKGGPTTEEMVSIIVTHIVRDIDPTALKYIENSILGMGPVFDDSEERYAYDECGWYPEDADWARRAQERNENFVREARERLEHQGEEVTLDALVLKYSTLLLSQTQQKSTQKILQIILQDLEALREASP